MSEESKPQTRRDPHDWFVIAVAIVVAVIVIGGLYLQETGRWDVNDHSTPSRSPGEYETEWGR